MERRRRWERPGSSWRAEANVVLNTNLADGVAQMLAEGCYATKWCEYHCVVGHETTDCHALGKGIEKLVKAGRLRHHVRSDHRRALSSQLETLVIVGQERESSTKAISTIAGAFGGGRDTCAARKRHVRAVNSIQETSFGFRHPYIIISTEDFVGIMPYLDDPIVVLLRINNLNIRRVLLDQGRSTYIIYGDTFDWLGLEDSDLTPYTRTLVGFSGKQVWVRGFLDLDTTFGENENAKMLRVRYLVLQVVGSYNMIIGRNTLN
ncbi:uncharacterized protein LOC130747138 [Lotus japonicus]|uniref:uncharacterized protein LOC130747138 n=1 Tax=Lotus japonicus TaxID=34305 RepID=UPI002589512F|nr:uncharacterized protein LOC130747138 [Lotus japonicus]